MRLIDADALAAEILDTYGSDAGSEDVNVIYGMVINAPTVIEVVTECPSDWDSPEDEIYDELEEVFDETDRRRRTDSNRVRRH